MAGRKKRGSTPGNNSKQSKPRRGEQNRQVKGSKAKETEAKGIRQLKLGFATTGTPENAKMSTPPIIATARTTQKKKLSFAEAAGTPQKEKGNKPSTSTSIHQNPKADQLRQDSLHPPQRTMRSEQHQHKTNTT
jgi:hypothetical protein